MNYGMRCHDICPKTDIDTLLDTVKENGICQIQLAFGKSISGFDFGPGHYSPGFAHMISDKLKARGVHVAVLGAISIQRIRTRIRGSFLLHDLLSI